MQAIGLPVVSFPETDFDFNSQVKVTYYFDMYIDTQSAGPSPTWLSDLFAGVNNIYPVPYATNLVGYDNSTFDECAKQLMTATDSGSAQAAAARCQEQLSLDVPAIPVYSKQHAHRHAEEFSTSISNNGKRRGHYRRDTLEHDWWESC